LFRNFLFLPIVFFLFIGCSSSDLNNENGNLESKTVPTTTVSPQEEKRNSIALSIIASPNSRIANNIQSTDSITHINLSVIKADGSELFSQKAFTKVYDLWKVEILEFPILDDNLTFKVTAFNSETNIFMSGEVSQNLFGTTATTLDINIPINFTHSEIIDVPNFQDILVDVPDNNESNISISFKVIDFDVNTTYTIIADTDSSGAFLNLDGTYGQTGKIDSETINLVIANEIFTPNKIYSHKIIIRDMSGNSVTKTFEVAIPVGVSGNAVDGYISNATVKIINKRNGRVVKTLKTDENGKFSFRKRARMEVIIEISGGIDTATGEPFSGTMKNIIGKDSANPKLNITPLTSLIVNLVETGESVDSAKNIIVESLDIDLKTLDADPIDTLKNGTDEEKLNSAKAMKTILTIQKLAEVISSVSDNSEETHSAVFKAIANQLKTDRNISNILQNSSSIINEVSNSKTDLEKEKLNSIKDLTQNTITVLGDINITKLAKATDIDAQIKQNASAVEVFVIPLKEKLLNIKNATNSTEVDSKKDEASDVINATISLGGIDGIAKVFDLAVDGISVSDFSTSFLNDEKIAEESSKFIIAINSGQTVDDILTEEKTEIVVAPITYNFGILTGTIYKETTGDNLQSGSELGIPNITVFAQDSLGIKETVTDSHGDFTFSQLVEGEVVLTVDLTDTDMPEGAIGNDTKTVDIIKNISNYIGTISFSFGDARSVNPASIAQCENPIAFTWDGSTVENSSKTVWEDIANNPSTIVEIGGYKVTLTLDDINNSFNNIDSGTFDEDESSISRGVFGAPYLTLYMGDDNDKNSSSLQKGDKISLKVEFNETVILDNWLFRDIDSGDIRNGESDWDWQDAVKVTGYDLHDNPVEMSVNLSQTTNLQYDNGVVRTEDNITTGLGTDSTDPKGHSRWSSNGHGIKYMIVEYSSGQAIENPTRTAIAVSGFAFCPTDSTTPPILTTQIEEMTSENSVEIEINGEANSSIFVNRVDTGIKTDINGTAKIILNTNGDSGDRIFNIYFVKKGIKSDDLRVVIEKVSIANTSISIQFPPVVRNFAIEQNENNTSIKVTFENSNAITEINWSAENGNANILDTHSNPVIIQNIDIDFTLVLKAKNNQNQVSEYRYNISANPDSTTENLDNQDFGEVTRADALRFLRQASFRSSETDIEYLIANGYEAWIDNQLSLVGDLDNNTDTKYGYLESMFRTLNKIDSDKYPAKIFANPTKLVEKDLDITRINVFRGSVFWKKALEDENQLRQRLTYALSQILVTSDVSPAGLATRFRGESSATYYDILYKHAFGNYRNLLTDVTHSSAMGYFLTYIGSKKDAPDENYARELTQLFTVGLYELELDGTKKLDSTGNPIPSYDQQHVTDLARVFTGWDLDDKQVNNRGDFSRYGSTGKTDNSWMSPLQFNLEYHDVNTTLDLIGDATMKTSSDGSADVETALNILFGNKNVAPYISRHLIMRFVTSNPTPAYVERVASKFNNNGSGVKGDLKAVIKAILLDPEARKGDVANFGKVDEMTVALPHILHSFGVKPIPSMKFGKQEVKNIYWLSTDRTFGQAVLSADSVFNFYSNEFIPSDPAFANNNLVAPELQTQTTPSLIEFNNLLKNLFITKEKYLQVDIGNYSNMKAWSDARKFPKFTLSQGLLYLDLTPEYDVLEKALDNKEVADGNFTNMGDSNTHIEDRERGVRALLDHLGNKLFGKPIPEAYVTAMITHFEKMSFPKSDAGRQNRAKMIVTTAVQAIVTSQLYMVLR